MLYDVRKETVAEVNFVLVRSIRLREGYVLKEMAGEFNIFYEADQMNGALVCMPSINELGLFLWTKLLGGASCEELVRYTMERNEIDEEEAEMDVGEFLAKLIHAGIIEYEI